MSFRVHVGRAVGGEKQNEAESECWMGFPRIPRWVSCNA